MKVLTANKFNFVNGGSDRYFLDTARLLTERGIDVARFCMKDARNEPSDYERYFVSGVDYNAALTPWQSLRAAGRLMYNFEAKRLFTSLVADFRPDLIHVHNIYHQISPSILPVAKHAGIPVIMHLHDYKLISPNYAFFCGGRICERGAAPHYFGCVPGKCVKDSYAKSFLAACEMHFHHTLLGIYEKNVELYIAPSQFLKDMCVRRGVPAEKIEVLPNYAEISSGNTAAAADNSSSFILYAGRLSPEKGVEVLLRALALVPGMRLKIAGEGESEPDLRALAASLEISERVDFLGKQSPSDLRRLMAEARCLVVPSLWYENMPLVVLEAFAQARPVIASRIGGLPELVREGENGLLFTPGDDAALAASLRSLDGRDEKALSAAALASAQHYLPAPHIDRLLAIYQRYAPR